MKYWKNSINQKRKLTRMIKEEKTWQQTLYLEKLQRKVTTQNFFPKANKQRMRNCASTARNNTHKCKATRVGPNFQTLTSSNKSQHKIYTVTCDSENNVSSFWSMIKFRYVLLGSYNYCRVLHSVGLLTNITGADHQVKYLEFEISC